MMNRKLNALIVDDEAVVLNSMKKRIMWDKYGVENVYEAGSMAIAKEIFEREHIDFMLSDVEMPQGSGLELFEWVKLHYPATECIYVTCHPEYDYMRKAMLLGSVDYILKPIDYSELDEILTKLVERLQSEREKEEIPGDIVIRVAVQESQENHNQSVHDAKRFILEHIQEDICVDDIAMTVHLNASYLMRTFKKGTGVSILEYITNERIKLAKEILLSTDYPVTKVAELVGYPNYSYFTKIFKKSVGVGPKGYRNENAKSHF
ncbi:response regulator transcription factor [Butyrivibrio sp. MB2005]|uniref:response regulator transcription factor n=1 Tax=Butyrivibrio sp. MB2005 TaxID=1280678 RepID=UPI0018C9CDB1|nr:response regulator [Butyrivibrio sp. MB2005]